MKDKHTPGPWKADEFGYINASGQQIADVYVYDSKDCMDCGQCEIHSVRNEPKLPYQANARLIAAAPEMFDALRDLYNASVLQGMAFDMAWQNAITLYEELTAKIEGDEN